MSLPLKGVTVLDLSLLLPGPLCSMYLADMGADVIKVENPRASDGTRHMFKSKDGLPGLYLMLNRNKKAITLNLKRKESKEILYKLLKKTDILLEGFRPGTMDDMGLGYKDLKKDFPSLIYCAINGYGDSGNLRDHAGHDGNYLAMSGVLEQFGTSEYPSLIGAQLADIGGGSLTALSAILAALYQREKMGKGQKLDISMMEASLQFLSLYTGIYLSTGELPERGNELLSGKLPNYNIYRVMGGRFVFLGTLEERFFKTFLRKIGKDSLLEDIPLDEEHFQRWKEILNHYFAGQNFETLKPLFENTECCLSPIKNLEEIFNDENLKERGMVLEMNHPVYGNIKQIGSPFPFIRKNMKMNHPPEHGEHTEEILRDLGYVKSDIEVLKSSKVI